jgi:hypothetical protein
MKRRIQPGDRHQQRPTSVRISPELRRDLRKRAADETVAEGRNVTFRDVLERAALAYLRTPIKEE